MTRLAMLHTGAVVIEPFAALARQKLPEVEVQHLLDDKIVADLGNGVDHDQIATRLRSLGAAAVASGADRLLLTCSSISGFAGPLAAAIGIPVLRIDEAMADEAIRRGTRIGIVATLETTLRPTVALLAERAAATGREIVTTDVVVPGAFEAVASGDRTAHDQLVAAAITELSADNDVIVLAQASMASAADQVRTAVPVLSSPELGIDRVAGLVRGGGDRR
ncbi:aspartate/glutamate racemase family protein [Microlunatus soli]|uniref:Aspartate/glutamate racemase n=1 Tax=Microlunatus soli TaxID=630515 RepID=A0A1H1ZRM1_9ACTN|nr:aspartate/glutamate racemase family protein [Microlunatus soli]SDT36378.1 hypothetical protein SAMN04489812_5406 [Microlunatus soli]